MNTFIIYYDNSNLLSFISYLHKIVSSNHKYIFKQCVICKRYYFAYNKRGKCCSTKCKKLYNLYNITIPLNDKKFENCIEGIDYIKCPLCGFKTVQLNSSHFTSAHNISFELFKAAYHDYKISADNFILSTLSGNNNPNSKVNASEEKRKACSPFSKDFYIKRNLSLEDRDSFIKSVNLKKEYTVQIDYYLNRGYSNDEAKKLLHNRQQTFTLEKCKEKYGEELGYKIWKDRQNKWKSKVFNETTHISTGTSIIAINFINEILCDVNSNNFLYGKNEKFIYDNKNKKAYKFDLTNEKTKRIIEFNGDFWHMNPKIYNENDINTCHKMTAKEKWEIDRIKIDAAKSHGYEVLVIWESDYKNNHDEIINECRKFIL